MGWQPQDSNLPAQAVFLDSGHKKSIHSRCSPERQCQLPLQPPNPRPGAWGQSDYANHVSSLDSTSQHAASSTGALSPTQTRDAPQQPTTANDDAAPTHINGSTLHTSGLEQNSSANHSTLGVDIDVVFVSSYILGKDIDIAILKGENVAQLFSQLEEIDKDKTQESVFFRNVRYLHSLQVPLERFKLALDLASPLTNIEPHSSTVFGVVRSVTAIAISFATADLEFAKQIGEMLEQISYIDDCDTLGQKANKIDIHKALVLVYQNLLEFYSAAFEILTMKEAKLVMRIILETDRLPNIVQDFLKHADNLRKLVQKATWEIVKDIKAMLYDHEIARWLGSGKTSQQSKHHIELQDLRADQACEFLLADAKFISWYRAANSQQLICYHYCRDDETGQAIYIFSNLILLLLEQLSGLKKTFLDWYKQAITSGNFEPATDAKKLEGFLQKILQTLDRPFFIVIDGLDECDRPSQNSLLKSLKRLSQMTPRLRLIISPRPQEEILEQLSGIAKIDLSSDANRDRVIVEKTVERKLFNLSKDVRALVIETPSPLAQGSAIWTRMIVEPIEVRKIKALSPMQDFLENIPLPKQLSELYGTLISRCTSDDPENLKVVTTALEVLAIVRRPLSILELAWAVALGSAREEVSTVTALARLVDHQRVMSLIHPFVAHVDFNDVKKRQVKLVHQSVKEFIVRTSNRSGLQKAAILGICIRYLLLDDFGHTDLFSEEQVAIEELPQEFDLFNNDEEPLGKKNMIRYDPTDRGFGELFVYASCHWLEHFGAVTVEPLPGLENIENLCQAGSTRLQNWIKQKCRPECTIKPRSLFDSRLYDPLSITSLYGSESMLRDMLESSDFDNDKFLHNPAMGAADQILQWGDFSRLRILFFRDFFRLVMKQWSNSDIHCQDWDVVFDLIDDVLDIMVKERWGNEFLCMAASMGCMPILRRLCNPAMFRLLVPYFKHGIHQTDYQKETVLVRIIKHSSASQDRYELAKILLLEGGANWDELRRTTRSFTDSYTARRFRHVPPPDRHWQNESTLDSET
ncbi:hypothetical protein BJ878DRAFT_580806 [Calycina marina]|uniref:Nephrocystin 3-like N-terminal domain-containing protein n=1 Tax=Calycina marina TaxID=1763456 RepID=A0A9P7Z8G4_9HELO|nr:hypothetical protein BJ878DRAFT_580806 [Calycina marina]